MNTQDKIIQKLGGYDKTTHFFAGAWLSLLVPTWYYAIGLAVVLAVGKEFIDKFIRKKEFDLNDLTATVAGGVLSAAVIFLKDII